MERLIVPYATEGGAPSIRLSLIFESENPLLVEIQCDKEVISLSRPSADCLAPEGLLSISVEADSNASPGNATLVAIDNLHGQSAQRSIAVTKPKVVVVQPPGTLDVNLESLNGFNEKTFSPTQVFPVSDAPLSAIASGEAGLTTVTLSVVDGKPLITADELDGYGDLEASFDVNGSTEGGTVKIALHHRRPFYVALALIALGSLAASGLGALQRHLEAGRQKAKLKDQYNEAETKAVKASSDLIASGTAAGEIDIPTLSRSWDPHTVLSDLSDDDREDAQKVSKYAESSVTFIECCELATSVLGAYQYFHVTADSGKKS